MSVGVPCPECGRQSTRVIDSRPRDAPVPHNFRRRQCSAGHRFSTAEFLDDVDFRLFIDARSLSSREREAVRQLVSSLKNDETREA